MLLLPLSAPVSQRRRVRVASAPVQGCSGPIGEETPAPGKHRRCGIHQTANRRLRPDLRLAVQGPQLRVTASSCPIHSVPERRLFAHRVASRTERPEARGRRVQPLSLQSKRPSRSPLLDDREREVYHEGQSEQHEPQQESALELAPARFGYDCGRQYASASFKIAANHHRGTDF
jgi:hypothetical protein